MSESRLACRVRRPAEPSWTRTALVPVGETPTGAAGTAALSIQATTVQGKPPSPSAVH